MSKGKSPAFQFYASDFLTDTAEFTAEEVGVYIRLLCLQWSNGSINGDPIRLGPDAVKVWDQLKSKFEKGSDGRLRNPRLEEVRQEQEAYRAKQSESGSKGAAKRWGNGDKDDSDANGDPNSDPNGQNIALHTSTSTSTSNSNTSDTTSASKPAKSEFSPFMVEMQDIYLNWYFDKTGVDYHWAGKDSKALGGIVAKIKASYKKKNNNEQPSPQVAKDTFSALLKLLPEWFQEKNCDLSTINGKYNSIVNQIIQANGKGEKSATGAVLADIKSRT